MKVLAIGLDAAEPSLIRSMIDDGELPAMRALLADGTWSRVESPAYIGSGAVWPSFITGHDAREHGFHSEWCWHRESMSLRRYSGADITPQWSTFPGSLGLFDVPYSPFLGVRDGFEISEWGAHDALEGQTRTTVDNLPPHSFENGGLDGAKARGAIAASLIGGVDLAIIVFNEIHHASHEQWPDVRELYREVDRQIGTLSRAAGDDAAVFVFSLHGFRPAQHVPDVVETLLADRGDTHLEAWSARSLFAALKQHAPAPLKRLYHRWTPAATVYRLAQPTMLKSYDWSRTRAFPFPTDQHGWIRVNLAGREARGIVAARDYDAVCDEIAAALHGHPLVAEVLRIGNTPRLPDLVVHWTPPYVATTSRRTQTGQHASDGFLIGRGARAATIRAENIYGLLVETAENRMPSQTATSPARCPQFT